jgi:hypothetical protein
MGDHSQTFIPKDNVPVRWENTVIGTCSVDEDGTVSLSLNDSALANDVRRMISKDILDHISIEAWEDTTPAEPQGVNLVRQNVFDKEG